MYKLSEESRLLLLLKYLTYEFQRTHINWDISIMALYYS